MPTLRVDGADLHYETTGSGPSVVLIQGSGVAGSGWAPQVAALSKDFRCLSFDNRGIGKSTIREQALSIEQMAEDARALMDALGWESAHLVGHSMGGLIAQQLALDIPKRIRSLALLCTFTKGPEAARITPQTLWLGLRTYVGTAAMRRRAFLKMLFPDDFVKREGAEDLARRVGSVIGRDLASNPPILMKQLAAMKRYDSSQRFAELAAIPSLVASAEHDPIALPKYGRELSRLIPKSRFVEVPNASHGVTIQMPERVNEMLRLHFDRAGVSRDPGSRE